MPQDQWKILAEIFKATEPDYSLEVAYLEAHLPDAVEHPASSALSKAYLSRLKLQLEAFRGGPEAIKAQHRAYPTLTRELQEMKTWLAQRKTSRKLPAEIEERCGNWIVASGRSYSDAKRMLAKVERHLAGRGAPSKRPEALALMDARITKHWSYNQLARNRCDCGLPRHTEHCRERIRKRIKELEQFLAKYGITFPRKES